MTKYFIRLSYFILWICIAIPSQAEVTDPTAGEYDDAVEGTAGKRECRLRVRSQNYNIRSSGHLRSARCGDDTLRSAGLDSIVALGSMSQSGKIWIQFAHKGCPDGIGYVHENALKADDVQAYQSGSCGLAITYGYRNPPAAPAPTTPPPPNVSGVQPIGQNPHLFPLDRCMGIKNRGGAGHYGAGRVGGRTHAGCDYYSPKGTPLRSPCNGRVTVSGRAGIGGNMIQINCDNGDYFKMMHLNSSPRMSSRGSRVSAGTVVGGVGNTGNARRQAPHLHLEAVIRGRRQDPQKLWNCGGDSGY